VFDEWQKPRKLFASGSVMYFVGFLSPAVGDRIPTSHALPGYFCALFALSQPWTVNGRAMFFNGLVEYLSILVSGWINPVFLMVAALQLYVPDWLSLVGMRLMVVLMIPSCWVVFYYERFHPREGHILWIVGMLLVLFSGFDRQFRLQEKHYA
jgi:hypothetical protein